jgi:hypothetical protein
MHSIALFYSPGESNQFAIGTLLALLHSYLLHFRWLIHSSTFFNRGSICIYSLFQELPCHKYFEVCAWVTRNLCRGFILGWYLLGSCITKTGRSRWSPVTIAITQCTDGSVQSLCRPTTYHCKCYAMLAKTSKGTEGWWRVCRFQPELVLCCMPFC